MLGQRIRELRKVHNWDQSTLAEAVGMNQSQVSKVEREDRKLTAAEAVKFAKALHVDISDLYNTVTKEN